jgi:hypothetical protein
MTLSIVSIKQNSVLGPVVSEAERVKANSVLEPVDSDVDLKTDSEYRTVLCNTEETLRDIKTKTAYK